MVIFDTSVPIHDEQKILRPGMRPLGRAVRPTGRTALHTVLDAELWKALGSLFLLFALSEFSSSSNTRRSHITTELVTGESRRSKRENLDNRCDNII
jgi:hypothetical protein